MSMSFEALAAQIRQEAQILAPQSGPPPRLTDEDWTRIELPEFVLNPPALYVRAWLNTLPTEPAVRYAYQTILGREADPEGLRAGIEQVENGVPISLLVAHMQLSDEGRRQPRIEPGFGGYRRLAQLRALLRKVGQEQFAIRAAQALAALHRRWDIDRLFTHYRSAVTPTLQAWHPALERLTGQLGALQQRLSALETDQDQMVESFRVAAARSKALAELPDPASAPVVPAVASERSDLQQFYIAFEDAHRGSKEAMHRRYLPYGPLLNRLAERRSQLLQEASALPGDLLALDLGCGRGEWLQELSAVGIPAKGVDSNVAMVNACQAQGLAVCLQDLRLALRATPSASLLLVSAFHVAEHLPFELLFDLVHEAARVLRPGGVLLLETPNPENLLVATHTFYHDYTHRNPLTPSSLGFLLRFAGLHRVDVLRLNPYPPSARVPGTELVTERLNGLLCGPQDFAVVGER